MAIHYNIQQITAMSKQTFSIYFLAKKKAVLVRAANKAQARAYAKLAFRLKQEEFTVLIASPEQVLYAEKMHLKIHDACIQGGNGKSPEKPSNSPLAA